MDPLPDGMCSPAITLPHHRPARTPEIGMDVSAAKAPLDAELACEFRGKGAGSQSGRARDVPTPVLKSRSVCT
jgi:hypothetical protein